MKKITLVLALFAWASQAQLRLVKDLNNTTATSNGNPLSLHEHNGLLLFTSNYSDTSANRYIFYSDGTTAGTNYVLLSGQAIKNQNTTMYYYQNGSVVYFDGIDSATSHMSLMSMADPATVYSLMDIYSKTQNLNSRFGPAAKLGNYLVFSPLAGQNVEPLVYGGSNNGVLNDINMGNAVSSSPTNFTTYGGKIYFSAEELNNGRELWSTDGTNVGTALYQDMIPGTTGGAPDYFNVIGSSLYLVSKNASSGRELRYTNGVNNFVGLVKDINPSGDSNPTNMKLIGTTLYFSADDGTNGAELWKSDGTSVGTVLVKNINTTAGQGSNPSDFTQVGSLIYFLTDNGSGGKQLWKTDGTTVGTTLVTNVTVAPEAISSMTAYNGKLYFAKMFNTGIKRLWVSNGTASGTTQLLPGALTDGGLVVLNDELYFGYTDTTGGSELYAYKDPALAMQNFDPNDLALKISPNPAQQYFELEGNVAIDQVLIYNLQGQLVKSFNSRQEYDISSLASGTYLVKVVLESGSVSRKLIKN